MKKAKCQKMYTEKHKQDMDFVVIGDDYIGPFADACAAQKAVAIINNQFAAPKPRTRTEYEKVTDSIFDLRDEFERGELYCKHEIAREFTQVINTQTLAQALHGGFCFRKVEKEIDWTNDVMDFLRRELHDGGCVRNASIESLGDNFGCVNIDISFRHERFLELCRVALRANGELD